MSRLLRSFYKTNNKNFGKNFIKSIHDKIDKNIYRTPLQFNERLSKKFNANIYLKREDLQKTRSFKIRGSLSKILNCNQTDLVCASAGNHAQGVAYSCNLLGLRGKVFVPLTTPEQKKKRILHYGGKNIELISVGNNFSECLNHSLEYSLEKSYTFIHPYDDLDVIYGQSTIAYEIFQEMEPDIIVSCVGGGGMISGIGSYIKDNELNCSIFGGEPENADSLYQSLLQNERIKIENIDSFVDGASVSQIGEIPFDICTNKLNLRKEDIKVIPNGKLCNDLLAFYEEDGIILEPAGVLSTSTLNFLNRDEIEGKNIVCILSGGNNDVTRYQEIIEKNLIYLGLKNYFIIEFTQKPKQIKRFIRDILGKNDDITRFEYIKKTEKSFGNVLVGLQTDNVKEIEYKLTINNFKYKKIKEDDLIYSYLV